MRLIVNGDDFGFSPGQNLGIIKAHREGILTSTTALANGEYLAEGLEEASRYPGLGIGVHLTLDLGRPVLSPQAVPSLVDERGCFRKHPEHLKIDLDPDQLLLEWTAQIEKIKSLGVMPTHLDGHHHLHLHRDVMRTTLELAERYDLPIRYLPLYHGEAERRLIKEKRIRILHGLADFYGDSVSEDYFLNFASNHDIQEENLFELMCHPAYVDDIIYTRSSYNIHRVKELVILTSEAVQAALTNQNIQLGNVRDFRVNL
ncbi:chitin disaccharide deacetylase [Proteiniclasticum sp. C24MP]|uniref:chitin disaccharide deacetylase n=1 Tax=Proteiniclasticum sp. C24MP TaxID=3374101 RepID=UPI0037541B7C